MHAIIGFDSGNLIKVNNCDKGHLELIENAVNKGHANDTWFLSIGDDGLVNLSKVEYIRLQAD